jgi:general secretion pathway protein A
VYRSFFQLQDNPFGLTPDPDYLFLGASHQEALGHVAYGVRQAKGFIEIIGAPGTGKTTLCRHLLERPEPGVRTAYVFNTFLSDFELLQAVCEGFGLKAGGERKALTDALNRFLIETAAQGERAVLLVDEAQNLSAEAFEQLRMLSNLETATEKLLQVVLMGQPELHARLVRPDLRRLNERVAVRHRLAALTEDECAAYVRHRLGLAGWRGLPQIEPQALQAVWRYSQGIPRRINLICDRALLAAYIRSSRLVSEADVSRARSEMEALDDTTPALSAAPVARASRLPRPRAWMAACLLAALLGAGGWAWLGAGEPSQEVKPQFTRVEQPRPPALAEAVGATHEHD